MSRRASLVLAAAIILLAPFGEGGRTPEALFLLHTLSLACVVLAWLGPAGPRLRPAEVLADPHLSAAGLAAAGVSLALLSALRASYPLAAALGSWDLVVPFALFVGALRAGSGGWDLGWLRGIALASTSLQALLAVARYFRGGAMAAGSSFLNPNHLAAFLNLGLFLALASAGAPAARLSRAIWGALAALHVVGLFLLESRGALVAFFAALALFVARHFRGWTTRGRAVATGALLACALLAVVVLGARFSRSFDPYRFSRVAIWRASLAMIAERPLLGFGPGMFPHVAARFNFPSEVGPVRYGRSFQGAHSAFLTLAAETGVPAAVSIGAALFGLTFLFLRRRAPGDGVAFGIGLGFLALLVQGSVEDLQVRPALTIVPALLAGVSVAAARRRRSGQDSEDLERIEPAPGHDRTRPAHLVGATLAVYVFVVAILLPYWADHEAHMALRLGRSGLFHMERASVLNPLHPDYKNDLAMAILNSGQLTPEGYARVAANLLEARRLKPIDYRFALHLARLEARFAPRLFDDRAAMERAVPLYREAVRLAPLDPRPRLELAAHLLELKRPGEALLVVGEALALEPNFLRARILQASILLDMGRRDAARESLRRAETTRRSLLSYAPDSGYSQEISMDARGERERLAAILREGDPSDAHS